MSVDPRIARIAQAVKRKCNLLAFREGTTLADGALLVREADDERVVAVRAPHFESPLTVALYLDTEEWSCDCGGELDPCAHVAAATVALTREDAPRPLATLASVQATIGYAFRSSGGALALARVARGPNGEEHAIESLAHGASTLGDTPLAMDDDDRRVDRTLAMTAWGALDRAGLEGVLDALSRLASITLDGAPVRASSEPAKPVAKLSGGDRGWTLSVQRPAGCGRTFAPGVAVVEGVLRPLAGTGLFGRGGERLPIERRFDGRDTVELVTKVLPELDAVVQWKHRAPALPRVRRDLRPSVLFELDHGHRALSVLPWIVYGEPPVARVEAGRLVYLRGDVPARNEAAEVDLGHALRDRLGLIPGKRVTYEGEDAGRFLARMRDFDAQMGGAHERLTRRKLVPSLTVDGEQVELSFELEAGGRGADEEKSGGPRRASAESVLRAFEGGLDLVALEGGGFAPLPRAWIAQNGHLVAQLLAARDAGEPRTAAGAAMALCAALETPPPPALARLAPLFDPSGALPPTKLPAGLTATLRPYQREGVDWLGFLREGGLGGVLADDMGLGKTLQTLAVLRRHAERESSSTHGALVVCPRSVLHNWADEAARFRPDLRVRIHHGERRELDPGADLTITTYATLRLDASELAAPRWDAVVLDEAQNIKNPDSQSARAAYGLRAHLRVALSGTPVENKLEELWSVLHFAVPGLLGGRAAFDERVARRVADGDARALAGLRERIRPFVLRRRKSDVLRDLPSRTDAVIECELDAHERSVYDAVKMASLAGVVRSLREGGEVMQALELLLRLRQASCDPALVPGQRDAGESAKVQALCEALEGAVGAGHKGLVFSQWTSFLDRVEPALRGRGIAFVRLDGSTVDRAGVVRTFQSADGPPVLLATLKAGGTGLNLTAADHVFLLDPWWNPAAEDQAADRAHRMGQTRPVTVYRLIARDTVESRILGLQARKRALAAAALDEGTLGAALTREDLLNLLEGA
jgi:superfamily II DNA or RNA helicase